MIPVFIWLHPDSLPPLEHTKHRDKVAQRHAAFNLTKACLLLLTFHIQFISALILVQFHSINITGVRTVFIEQMPGFNYNLFILFGRTSIIDELRGNYLEAKGKTCMPQKRSDISPQHHEEREADCHDSISCMYGTQSLCVRCAPYPQSHQLLAMLWSKPHCPLMGTLQQYCNTLVFFLFDFINKTNQLFLLHHSEDNEIRPGGLYGLTHIHWHWRWCPTNSQ